MRLDSQDRQMLIALDPEFEVNESSEIASVSGPMTIKIERVADDRLQLTIEFSDREIPIPLSRAKTLEQLNIKASES